MNRLGTTFSDLLARTRARGPVMEINANDELVRTEALLNAATPELPTVAIDPLAIITVLANHRMAGVRAGQILAEDTCRCGWFGLDHDEHIAELITTLARPVSEVVREALTAAELRMFGAYVIDPRTGVNCADFRRRLWESGVPR